MPIAGKDSRQYQRRTLYYYLRLLDRDTGEEIGRLVDIHVGGLLFISNEKFESGLEYNLRIPLKDEPVGAGSSYLDMKAVVRWSRQDINPDYYVTGMQFIDIDPGAEDVIEELVRKIGFKK